MTSSKKQIPKKSLQKEMNTNPLANNTSLIKEQSKSNLIISDILLLSSTTILILIFLSIKDN
jgi:hypothetical protein